MNLTMMSKYGCDGASGQSQYKQKFKNGTGSSTDSQVFMISLVPIRIVEQTNLKNVHWQNECTGSPRYCRPIKFMFTKECKELTVCEMQKIKDQIDKLDARMITIGDQRFIVKHLLFLYMVDGKTCQYITNTDSSTTCIVCKATPNEMNVEMSNNFLVRLLTKLYMSMTFHHSMRKFVSWSSFFTLDTTQHAIPKILCKG